MKPTAPKNFDGDAATDRTDPTWKASTWSILLDDVNRRRARLVLGWVTLAANRRVDHLGM